MTIHRSSLIRRFLATGLAAMLLATACAGEQTPSGVDAPTPGAVADGDIASGETQCPTAALADADVPVEIEFWHAMSATTGEVLDELVAAYNDSQAEVHVTAVYQGGYDDNFNKYISTLRSGGTLPSMIQLNETSMQQMVDSQSTIAVEHCVTAADYDLSDFPTRLLEQYRIGGELVTLPFQLANPVLFYDGNDFVAAGLDPEDPPSDLVELEAISRALVDTGTVPTALILDVDAWPFEQWVNTAGVALVDNDNGRAARAQNPGLDSEAVGDVLEWLDDMHDAGLLQITGRGGDQAALAKFIAVGLGNATMTIASSASLGEIYNQLERAPGVDLRVGPFPGLPGGATAVGGGSLYLVNETDDAERAAVWDFMTWLDEPAQQVRWSAGTGYIPTRSSAIDDPDLQALWAERPGFRVAFDQLDRPGDLPGGGGPVIGDYLGFRDAIEDGLEALYAGDDPADVQAGMQSSADEAIDDYNRRIGE
jgi:sn-glycerol 3-phosphate transport system substrate-binding protein